MGISWEDIDDMDTFSPEYWRLIGQAQRLDEREKKELAVEIAKYSGFIK